MKYSLKSILLLFIASSIYLLLNGCASQKYVYVNPIKEHILKSPTAIAISPEEFGKLNSKYDGPAVYGGLGSLWNIQWRGMGLVDPVFEKILYDPADSSLYIEGVVYEYSKKPIGSAQIILGKLPEVKKDTYEAKIDIILNYVIRKGGKFSTAFLLRRDYQIIFAPGDNYSDDGEYMEPWGAFIKAYDAYKLNELYRSYSK